FNLLSAPARGPNGPRELGWRRDHPPRLIRGRFRAVIAFFRSRGCGALSSRLGPLGGQDQRRAERPAPPTTCAGSGGSGSTSAAGVRPLGKEAVQVGQTLDDCNRAKEIGRKLLGEIRTGTPAGISAVRAGWAASRIRSRSRPRRRQGLRAPPPTAGPR